MQIISIDDRLGQRGRSGFSRRIVGRAGGKIDLDVEHRQGVRLDEEDTRARGRRPVLDGDACLRQRQVQAEQGAEQHSGEEQGEAERFGMFHRNHLQAFSF